MCYKFVKIAVVSFALSFMLICGCKSDKVDYKDNAPKAMKSANFNQETYVWENFLFPTNRTSGVK